MDLKIYRNREEMGAAAAAQAALELQRAIQERGQAHLIVATGASQFEVLSSLADMPGIDWSKVTGYHLDEYIGLSIEHPASFRKYLRERFVERVPELGAFHYVNGEAESPEQECARLGALLSDITVDVACIGIGENGHIAFNDPPADFETEQPYLVVTLDEACRRQQMGEGWFPSLEAVPRKAISMSVRQILKSRAIVCSVPDERKAEALRNTFTAEITPQVPASILRRHEQCAIFTDDAGASLLPEKNRLESAE